MGKEGDIVHREIVGTENLPQILAQIGVEREKKGTSESLIPYVREVREEAERLGEKSVVLQLYQEEFLSAQHMVMEEKAKRLKANPIRAVRGIYVMESTSRAMERYAKENHEDLDPVVNARVFRFLGRYADYKGQYRKSEEYYKKGLAYFDQSTEPEGRTNRLEFLGFLSYSLIKQGRVEEGVRMAGQILKDFDETGEGKWLKENNYYAWAVWKSGVEIRTAEHILKTKNLEYIDLAMELITEARNILVMPDGTREVFRLRLDELELARNLMEKV